MVVFFGYFNLQRYKQLLKYRRKCARAAIFNITNTVVNVSKGFLGVFAVRTCIRQSHTNYRGVGRRGGGGIDIKSIGFLDFAKRGIILPPPAAEIQKSW